MAQTTKVFGQSVLRKEDDRFLTGRGNFVADMLPPGTVFAKFVRSPYAHARIRSINTAKARRLPGVLDVLTSQDMKDQVGDIITAWAIPNANLKTPAYPPLAREVVRYAGEAVAVVVAESPFIAENARDLVEVEYDPLPVVTDVETATKPGRAPLHGDAPDNVAFKWTLAGGDVDKVFQEADVVVSQRFVNQRLQPTAMEPRAAIAQFEPGTRELTLHVTSQNPFVHRLVLSIVLKYPEHLIHVIAPDVGGGFGSKIPVYPWEAIVCHLAMRLGRPVKWVEDRMENYVATIHGRDHVQYVDLAAKKDGTILGIRARGLANMGAYRSTAAPGIPTILFGFMVGGCYAIQAGRVEVTGVFTNTTPVDAYRGAGRPEALFLLERIVDILARKLKKDPADIRRKNFIPADKFPYATAMGLTYDSGNYAGTLEKALDIVGDELGLPVADIEVVHGDTKLTPYGQGTYGSRTTPVEGGSIALSARKVKDKARKIAAHLLEAREEDLEFADGKFVVKGSPKAAKTIQEIAWAAYMAGNLPKGVEPVLDATTFYDPTNFVFPFGCHICVVDVDPETGQVKIRRYVAVDDVGNQINPMIVEGQVHGGVLQGLAQAMLEQSVYDENGNLLTNSLIEYLVPTALEAPRIETDSTVTPSPHNPLGVKGVGETGTIASSQAYVNAVCDALGVDHIDMPITPEKVWRVPQKKGIATPPGKPQKHFTRAPGRRGETTPPPLLQAGVRAADPRSDGFLIVLGDQPFVQSATINTLIERRNRSQAKILIPTYGGARGNPVLLDRSLSEDVQSITGDQGCRAIFGQHTRGILEVPVDDPGILVDLDTPEQITRAEEVVRTGRSIEGLVAMTEHDRSHSHPPGGAMRIDILQVAQDLRARNEPFVLATVVRVERPSSGRPGFKAIVRANRDLVGWLGGSCAQSG